LKSNKNECSNCNSTDEIKTVKISKNNRSKKYIWTLKITIVTFFLAAFFSFITEITSSKTNIIIASLLLILLILLSILFDAIAVSVTSCDLAPLLALASRKVPASKIAIKLVKNAEKVSNICGDVIGDICGIISGACGFAIISRLIMIAPNFNQLVLNIIISSIVAALTVGGKSYLKVAAINNSKEMVMFFSRLLNIFIKDK
jgi:CBS domain containing-hemolysin-like protein